MNVERIIKNYNKGYYGSGEFISLLIEAGVDTNPDQIVGKLTPQQLHQIKKKLEDFDESKKIVSLRMGSWTSAEGYKKEQAASVDRYKNGCVKWVTYFKNA